MKILRLRVTPVDLPLDPATGAGSDKQRSMGCALVFLESDQGLVGEGMTSSLNAKRLKVFVEMIESLAPFVVGLDPRLSGVFLTRAWSDVRNGGAQGVAASAVAAIDMALWDLRGKLAGLNVAHLLGAHRRRLPVYHSGGLWVESTIDQLQTVAARHKQRGFRAMKMRLSGEPARDRACVAAVRDAIGPDCGLLADLNQRLDAPNAIRLGRMLEQFALTWIEEPVVAHDHRGLKAVAAALDTPIAAGENASLGRGASELVAAAGVDVLMADLQRIGGPSEFLKAAACAELADIPFSSHLFSEMSLALLAAIPNATYLEYMPWHSPIYREEIALDDEGRAIVADAPGWGFSFDPDKIARFALA